MRIERTNTLYLNKEDILKSSLYNVSAIRINFIVLLDNTKEDLEASPLWSFLEPKTAHNVIIIQNEEEQVDFKPTHDFIGLVDPILGFSPEQISESIKSK